MKQCSNEVVEHLDIVDEDDNVIGRGTRKSVHDKHQIHRGIHVFIVNDKGELLIQQRSLNKDDRPGVYDASVGAQVSSGETYKQTALRETEEELGVKIRDLKVVCKYKSFSGRQREIRMLFLAYHNGPFKIDKEEVEGVEFKTVQDIEDLIREDKIEFTDGFKISFEHYLKYLKER